VRAALLALALDEFLRFVVDLDLELGLGRAGRGDPDGDFDMVLGSPCIGPSRREGARARKLETEAGNGCRD
jgi:hypothetical protein